MTEQPALTNWVDSTESADLALETILQYDTAGLDTEFYGCDITQESPVGRSICHVFSVACATGPLLPRGYHEATSWVFDGSLLAYEPVRRWLEDPKYTKPLHNEPADAHTFHNHGIRVLGAVNTLAMARFWYPNRVNGRGFGLDALGEDLCGVGKTEDYRDLLGYEAVEPYEAVTWKQKCSCGVLGCRKTKADKLTEHIKQGFVETTVIRTKKVKKLIPLTDLNPAHRLWDRYLAYAAHDAVLALWVYQLMLRDGKQERPYPWSIL